MIITASIHKDLWWWLRVTRFKQMKQTKMGNLWRCYLKHTSGKILGLMDWNLIVGMFSLLLSSFRGRPCRVASGVPQAFHGESGSCFQTTMEKWNYSDLPRLRSWVWIYTALWRALWNIAVMYHSDVREEGLWRYVIESLGLSPSHNGFNGSRDPAWGYFPCPRIQSRKRYMYQLAKPSHRFTDSLSEGQRGTSRTTLPDRIN